MGAPVEQFVIVPEIVPRGETAKVPGTNFAMRVRHPEALLVE
jgi:hypothetical protein